MEICYKKVSFTDLALPDLSSVIGKVTSLLSITDQRIDDPATYTTRVINRLRNFGQDAMTFFQLATRYRSFGRRKIQGPRYHETAMSSAEWLARTLHLIRQRTPTQEQIYQNTIRQLDADNKRKNYLGTATELISYLKTENQRKYLHDKPQSTDRSGEGAWLLMLLEGDRQQLRRFIEQHLISFSATAEQYAYLHVEDTAQISHEGELVIDLCLSRMLMMKMDQVYQPSTDKSKKRIAYLVPVAHEHNRLRPSDEIYTGEDLLRTKVMQLQFLYEGLNNFDWDITMVEDKLAYRDRNDLSIDVMQQQIDADPLLGKADIRERIRLLTHRDLGEERQLYSDRFKEMSAEEFARVSYKGGAIHVGLRYLAQCVPNKRYRDRQPSAIVITDGDISNNLGHSGILLDPIFQANKDLVVGSRRIDGAHVSGRSMGRKLASKAFNLLVRSFFVFNVNDTQTGAKAITPKVVHEIQHLFSEVGMSYDVELLKRVGVHRMQEVPIVWKDSSLESTSRDQAMDMFKGLLRIYDKVYRGSEPSRSPLDLFRTLLSDTGASDIQSCAEKLTTEGANFEALLQLARKNECDFLIRNAYRIFDYFELRDLKLALYDLKMLIYRIANNEIDQAFIEQLIKNLNNAIKQLINSDILNFIYQEFPELHNILELLHKDPNYLLIIVPMLFGTNLPGVAYNNGNNPKSLFQFGLEPGLSPEDSRGLYTRWVSKHLMPIASRPKATPAQAGWINSSGAVPVLPICTSKHLRYLDQLTELNRELQETGRYVTIGITFVFSQNGTSTQFVDANVEQKLRRLMEQARALTQIKWDITAVDARIAGDDTSAIDKYIMAKLTDLKASYPANARVVKVATSQFAKGVAVTAGLKAGLTAGCDYMAFIDFSPKIPIEELFGLVVEALILDKTNGRREAVVVGSRRLRESEVVNKSLLHVARSVGLNLVVKAMFPLLYRFQDTQTGFKLVGADAWKALSDGHLTEICPGMGFDVALLQYASKLDFPIRELPVDFYDTTKGSGVGIQEKFIGEVSREIIRLRAMVDDVTSREPANSARFINGGAENSVFLVDGHILKLPNHLYDVDFFVFIRSLFLQEQPASGVKDDKPILIENGVVDNPVVTKIIGRYAPTIRRWTPFNALVMKLIALLENKSFKSTGYAVAMRHGRDLMVPFGTITTPLAIPFQGEIIEIRPELTAYHSVPVTATVTATFRTILADLHDSALASYCEMRLRQLIDDAFAWQTRMWRRGLFDLDANFMSDLGFHHGQMMLLDPGEVFEDLTVLNLDRIRGRIKQRYDYIEMTALLEQAGAEFKDDLLRRYLDLANEFISFIELDIARPEQEREFMQDRRNNPDQDYSVIPPELGTLEKYRTEQHPYGGMSKYIALHYAGHQYQPPFMVNPTTTVDVLSQVKVEPPLNYNRAVSPFSPVVSPYETEFQFAIEPGNVVPLFNTVWRKGIMESITASTQVPLIVLDGGRGVRSSLIGLAAGSKGNIQLNGVAAHYRMAVSLNDLRRALSDLPQRYMIVSSCDNLLALTPEHIARIVRYFRQEPSPGLFHFDLPEAGRHILPEQLRDILYFFSDEDHSYAHADGALLLANNPITAGFARSRNHQGRSNYDLLFSAAWNLADHFTQLRRTELRDRKAQDGVDMPFRELLSLLPKGVIADYIVYNACRKYGGIKTPFFYIFNTTLLEDIKRDVLPLLPRHIHHTLTWPTMIQGMKQDPLVWDLLSRPAGVTSDNWAQVYRQLNQIKARHQLDYADAEQNQLRVFDGYWITTDSPEAIYQSSVEQYRPDSDGIIRDATSDHGTFTGDRTGVNIVVLNSPEMKGTINVVSADRYVRRDNLNQRIMLYGVKLPEGMTLDIPIGSLAVTLPDGRIAIMSMALMSKREINNAAVTLISGEQTEIISYQKLSALISTTSLGLARSQGSK